MNNSLHIFYKVTFNILRHSEHGAQKPYLKKNLFKDFPLNAVYICKQLHF